jgi:nicotinate dehydrogenase subunit A
MVTLTVNGTEHRLDIDPETPLLYVLRNDLGLPATRYGCGVGLCGSCTVLIGGRATRSCNTPVSAVAGPVTTVEGLAGTHPLQAALLDEQAGQCGYCLSGMIMSAKALLDATPSPTEAQLREALDENICRCGSHPRILRAFRRVAGIGP